ncbi:MAG: ERCC4 domain-containing protein [Dehalococcoidia bacterium]
MDATWILERCSSERFPYRLQIRRGDRSWLTLRVQDRWPGGNVRIFCMRERGASEDVIEEVERVPVVALQQRGPRLSVVLDRARGKRCDFLFLQKAYREEGRGSYEQIFWQTPQALKQRRPRVRVSPPATQPFTVRIASEERYPWRFPGAETERARLAVGDYALVDGDRSLAVVERKTFQNFLADLTVPQVLHQQLLELAQCEQHALVVEAPYADFINPGKLERIQPAYCARAIAELYAAHPALRLVFCSNRKTANEWTRNYFAAVWARDRDTPRPVEHDPLEDEAFPF